MDLYHRAREFKPSRAALWNRPLRFLFPAQCPGCRTEVLEPGALCGACWSTMRFLEQPWCEVSGVPFVHEVAAGTVSAAAIAEKPAYDRARAAVAYDGVARDLVQGLKFNDRTEYGPWMARWMVRAGRELLAETQYVTAVPLHRRRFLWRRFNQSAELARAVAAMTGLSFRPDLLRRVKPTRQQVGLGAGERHANVRGAFVVPDEARLSVHGARVLLVDDVFTTGATVDHASRALLRAGAGAVDVLTFARVVPGDFLQGDGRTI